MKLPHTEKGSAWSTIEIWGRDAGWLYSVLYLTSSSVYTLRPQNASLGFHLSTHFAFRSDVDFGSAHQSVYFTWRICQLFWDIAEAIILGVATCGDHNPESTTGIYTEAGLPQEKNGLYMLQIYSTSATGKVTKFKIDPIVPSHV
jgi:hypothetical protein